MRFSASRARRSSWPGAKSPLSTEADCLCSATPEVSTATLPPGWQLCCFRSAPKAVSSAPRGPCSSRPFVCFPVLDRRFSLCTGRVRLVHGSSLPGRALVCLKRWCTVARTCLASCAKHRSLLEAFWCLWSSPRCSVRPHPSGFLVSTSIRCAGCRRSQSCSGAEPTRRFSSPKALRTARSTNLCFAGEASFLFSMWKPHTPNAPTFLGKRAFRGFRERVTGFRLSWLFIKVDVERLYMVCAGGSR